MNTLFHFHPREDEPTKHASLVERRVGDFRLIINNDGATGGINLNRNGLRELARLLNEAADRK